MKLGNIFVIGILRAKYLKTEMDFLPGNNYEEWQFLGSSENAIPYQLVTVFNRMRWGDFEIEHFKAASCKFSGI